MNVIVNLSELSMTFISNSVNFLYEPVIVNVIVKEIIVFPIILLIVTLALNGNIVITEEEVQRFNS